MTGRSMEQNGGWGKGVGQIIQGGNEYWKGGERGGKGARIQSLRKLQFGGTVARGCGRGVDPSDRGLHLKLKSWT